MGFVCKLDKWVPHELKESHLLNRIQIADMQLKRHQNDPFLKRLVTGDEKWIVYNNIKRKKAWVGKGEAPPIRGRPDLHPKKVLLSIW